MAPGSPTNSHTRRSISSPPKKKRKKASLSPSTDTRLLCTFRLSDRFAFYQFHELLKCWNIPDSSQTQDRAEKALGNSTCKTDIQFEFVRNLQGSTFYPDPSCGYKLCAVMTAIPWKTSIKKWKYLCWEFFRVIYIVLENVKRF